MVRRYAHLSVEHLAEYADGLSEIRLVRNLPTYDLFRILIEI